MRRTTTRSARPGGRPPTSSTCSRTRWWRSTGTARRRSPTSPSRGRSARTARLYTFKLRDDVQFCSGKKFTAEDVIYSFKRLKSPEIKGPYAWRAGDIKELRAPDPYTVEYELAEPYLGAAAAAHHVHQRHPQQGERRGAGQGLRRQGRRRHRPVVLRIVAAAHPDRAEAPRRLQVGPLDVQEQGAGEVREAGHQDRAGGFEPRRRHDGRPVRHHPPVPGAVHRPGQGRADAAGASRPSRTSSCSISATRRRGRWWPTSACARP